MNCPLQRVRQVLQEPGAQSERRRDRPAVALVFHVMAPCLCRRAAYEEVQRVVVEGLQCKAPGKPGFVRRLSQ
jgi:Insertion element 4 transposase N-terminal